jgi:predicted ATPase
MLIRSLKIDNFKSLIDFELVEPNPFSVFVGPNAAGKSNIFEALEFLQYTSFFFPSSTQLSGLFGGTSSFVPFFAQKSSEKCITSFIMDFPEGRSTVEYIYKEVNGKILITGASWDGLGKHVSQLYPIPVEKDPIDYVEEERFKYKGVVQSNSYKTIIDNFSRIFINNHDIVKQVIVDDSKLSIDAGNLEKVLKRLLSDPNKKEEILEWLELLIPGLERVEVQSEELSGSDNLLIYEKGVQKPFNKKLISDGTYNIVALITALYQSDEPQFLCIEEPENGLNPKVVKELVNLFRQKCEEGHYIWLNTHSQTLVSQLEPKEIILVNKVNGITQAKQINDMNLHGLPMDEAWLTNALGGGIPW